MTVELSAAVKAQLDRMAFSLFLDYIQDKLTDRFYGLQTGRAYRYYKELALLANDRILKELEINRNAFEKGIGKGLHTATKRLNRCNEKSSNTQKAKLLTEFLSQYTANLKTFMAAQMPRR